VVIGRERVYFWKEINIERIATSIRMKVRGDDVKEILILE